MRGGPAGPDAPASEGTNSKPQGHSSEMSDRAEHALSKAPQIPPLGMHPRRGKHTSSHTDLDMEFQNYLIHYGKKE